MGAVKEFSTWWQRLRSRFFTLRAASYRHFGHLYGDRDSYLRAVEDLTRAISLDAGNSEALFMRGTLYWRDLGNTERAIRDLTAAWSSDETRWEALLNRGLARHEAGHTAGALDDLARYVELAPDGSLKGTARRLLDDLAGLLEEEDAMPPD